MGKKIICPVLAIVRKKFVKEKPLKGLKVGMASSRRSKNAVLVETLASGGAKDIHHWLQSLSTQNM